MANEEMNLAAMRKLMEENAKKAEENGETAIVGRGWMDKLATEESAPAPTPNPVVEPAPVPVEEAPATYNGPGLIIDQVEETEPQQAFAGVSPRTSADIESYLAEMDEEIEALEEAKAEREAQKAMDEETSEDEDESVDEETFNKNYSEAVVYIDKTGMGSIINFTDEEREKLEYVRNIKVNEVETVDVSLYRTKKAKIKKKDINKIIKRVNNAYATPVCLPLSGYTATIKGCSAYELMSLIDNSDNALLDAQTKWSLIHSKIESTSIGEMDFNTFLMNTAASDYNNFIYGILCATYPNDDTIPIKCPNEECGKSHEHAYSVKSLIRAEKMSDKLKDQFMRVVDASTNEADARHVHDESPLSRVTAIVLPSSGMTFELQVQSAYDLINNSIKGMAAHKNSKYAQAAILSTMVKAVYVEDDEEPGTYIEITEAMDIAQLIYNLNEIDILMIQKFGDELMGGMTVNYGFMNIKCPYCGNYIDSMPIDPENLLFHRYRQALTTKID